MLRLKVFGGLSLMAAGKELGGAALQPRRVALLAAIAAAGDRGLTRDRLLGLFWPDVDNARARQALSQALYALRKDTGVESLTDGTAILRIDETILTSDVAEFERALAAGDHHRAAELYAGPFLDGVYLSGSPEFEHWAEAERMRLAQQAERAISALAMDADARQDHVAAAQWWRRLAALDPFQTRAALGVIAAAAAAGDHAGALRHADAYARRIRDDLGVEPSTRVVELAGTLRAARAATGKAYEADPSPYEIERELGQGGMAIVYLARDRKHGRKVALKMLRPEVGSLIGAERLQREIMVTAGLQHPHILPLYDSGEMKGTLFYVMPFVEGESLRAALLREGPLAVDDALRLAGEIAGALEHAHRHGIVHRDIKPENILLADGHAIVADFGIAKAVETGLDERRAARATLTQMGTVLGTPAYMSPEQVAGGGDEVGPASDVFSLACVVFEMLTGRPPWIADSVQALMARRFTDAPPPLAALRPEAPPGVDAVLRRALDVDPSSRIGSAAELGRLLRDAATASAFPVTGRSRLPALAGSLIGREREMEVASSLLRRQDVPLLTLTGAGGSGKTRLALQLAADATSRFEDVHFVDLTSLANPAAVLPALAEQLGVRSLGERDAVELIARTLGSRHTLVVLDNVEHVIAAARDIARLLGVAPTLTVLATSRMRLGIRGEHEFVVAPLAVPAPDEGDVATLRESPAVRLFLERAQRAQPAMRLDEETVRLAARICARLDGLPLAIELTAARCRVLSPKAVLARLESSFAILAGGSRDMPARHRTMRQAIAWSHDLLTDADRALFAYLSVFSGGCTIEAAERVCAPSGLDVLAGVEALVDASLLLRTEHTSEGEPRLRMLEAVRQFAAEMLEQMPARAEVARRHTGWALALAAEASSQLLGASQDQALETLGAEHANLQVAIERVLADGDADAALRFGAALWRYWLIRSPLGEARAVLERILALPSGAASTATALRADVLTGAGQIAQNSGAVRESQAYFEAALAIRRELGDGPGVARALADIGWVAWRQCEYDESRRLSREALELARRHRDQRIAALALGNIGFGHVCQGDFAAARAAFAESLAIRESLDDARGAAFVRSAIAWAWCREGVLDAVPSLLDESFVTLTRLGDQRMVAWIHNVRAELLLRRGDVAQARELLEQRAMPVVRRVADRWALAHALAIRAWVAERLGDLEGAERFASESFDLRRAIGDRWGMAEIHALRAAVARARGHADEADASLASSHALRAELGDRAGAADCDRILAVSPSGAAVA